MARPGSRRRRLTALPGPPAIRVQGICASAGHSSRINCATASQRRLQGADFPALPRFQHLFKVFPVKHARVMRTGVLYELSQAPPSEAQHASAAQ
mmetsp:Transcript_48396/g.122190  ORF Transcript_48396/g.122190 Transcript_48396/m.122190 type:complete len:95 (-) Transcript_48396:179-463(-)